MRLHCLLVGILVSAGITAEPKGYRYDDIKQRYGSSALNNQQVTNAKMQGECLVGLKALNFKKTNEFDAVAEWTSYRSFSLLENYSPCEVLIMMETAKSKLQQKSN